ncbi:AGE family epimerase/isomerase [Collimonas humicola]|uniref:AGE family epimerase/isomerase n=1 Tax=Collimonas humicola TaxID=2825886 RepID=UPI001B8D67D8|nr:AGE family epimerase/isomerase [Collimonas humicola]
MNMLEPTAMPKDEFRHPAFLLQHVRDTMRFYHPRAIDATGGFYHFFKDDGSIYDSETRHLVSSTRFIFNYAMAYRQFGDPAYLDAVRHGVAFLRDVHWDAQLQGYDWTLSWKNGRKQVLDPTRHCYGLAFVLLAYAHAMMAGVASAEEWLYQTYDLLEQRFWEPHAGLYADEASAGWQLQAYRGQNANMHMTEALLAAYEASGDTRFLDRADMVARHITVRQAALSNGLIWEHYHPDWTVDWDYNKEDSSNIFRPWGFQPGHHAEWAKLLLILERHRPQEWLLPRAIELFDAGMDAAWDMECGGIYYGFAPDGVICDQDKYFWVQAESFAAAALLAQRTGKHRFWDWYDHIWQYSWRHFIDHQHGAWFRILTRDNRKYSDEKSPAGKTDYHTMGACYEVLGALQQKG